MPAAELLMVGYGARQHVRRNALQHLHQEITITRKQGSITIEECLTDSVRRGLVDPKDALERAGIRRNSSDCSGRVDAPPRRACQVSLAAIRHVAPELPASGSNLTLARRSTGFLDASRTARSAFGVFPTARIASP